MSWTEATSDDYGAIAVAFKETSVATGSASMTMANFTVSSSGSVIAVSLGTLDATLANLTLSAAGTSIISGSLDKTLAGATLESSGTYSCVSRI